MKKRKINAEKRPVRNANSNKSRQKYLIDMDSDEILERYEKGVAGGKQKKKPKMRVSGKSVFKIREIILKKSKRAQK